MNQPLFTNTPLQYHANRQGETPDYPHSLLRYFSLAKTAEAVREISAWPGYHPTPLVQLAPLATEFGLGGIYYKDEASRFGLGSFKALGGAYAVLYLLQRKIIDHCGKSVSARDLEGGQFRELVAGITVVTATDGNHGRSVAWAAQRFGCRCRIYIHAGVSERREQAMQELGAEVIRVSGNYDESVRVAASDARAQNWHVVSDTSYRGYTELPAKVMAGYSVMLAEIMQQLPSPAGLTHLFVQGGVGGLAAAATAYLWEKLGANRPRCIVVEPVLADCLFQSARNNRITVAQVTEESIMAGLSCGEVSKLAWEVLGLATDDFMTITDELVAPVMRMLAQGSWVTVDHRPVHGIEAGESAVAGLAACLAASQQPKWQDAIDLNENSQVLVLGTEGATDREIYQKMVGDNPPNG